MISPRSFLEAVKGYVNPDEGIQNQRQSPGTKPWKIGTILAAPDANGLPRVLFDGESVPSERGYQFASSYDPMTGDRVVLAPIGSTYMVMAAVGVSSTDTGWVTSGVLTPATGITLSSYRIRRIDKTVLIAIDPFTVDSISVPVTGDIGNRAVATVTDSFYRPTVVQGLSSASTGRLASGYINGAGVISLSAVSPDATQTGSATVTNMLSSLAGTYAI